MAPYLISLLIALGVYFLGRFIGKSFNLSPNSYLGFAIISFVLAFICHTEGQEVLLKRFTNFPFIDRSTIIWPIIGLCGISLLLIFFVEGRRKQKVKNDNLFPRLRISALKKYATKWSILYPKLKKITLYEAPATYPNIAGVTIKYLLIFEFSKWRKGRHFARIFMENNLGIPDYLFDEHFSEVYLNDDFPINFRDHWITDTVPHEDVDMRSSVLLWKK